MTKLFLTQARFEPRTILPGGSCANHYTRENFTDGDLDFAWLELLWCKKACCIKRKPCDEMSWNSLCFNKLTSWNIICLKNIFSYYQMNNFLSNPKKAGKLLFYKIVLKWVWKLSRWVRTNNILSIRSFFCYFCPFYVVSETSFEWKKRKAIFMHVALAIMH